MAGRSSHPTAIDAEVNHVRSLGIVALRMRWRAMFDAKPTTGLTKDILARMIAYRIQEQAFGGLEKETVTLLKRLARGDRPVERHRRLKSGTVLIREHQGERYTVTVVPDGFLWRETTYRSLSTIARIITGTSWSGPRFFGLRTPAARNIPAAPDSKLIQPSSPELTGRRSSQANPALVRGREPRRG
jgi:hypothetical protein